MAVRVKDGVGDVDLGGLRLVARLQRAPVRGAVVVLVHLLEGNCGGRVKLAEHLRNRTERRRRRRRWRRRDGGGGGGRGGGGGGGRGGRGAGPAVLRFLRLLLLLLLLLLPLPLLVRPLLLVLLPLLLGLALLEVVLLLLHDGVGGGQRLVASPLELRLRHGRQAHLLALEVVAVPLGGVVRLQSVARGEGDAGRRAAGVHRVGHAWARGTLISSQVKKYVFYGAVKKYSCTVTKNISRAFTVIE